ncbi:hypothetical protein DM01DRAFT_1305594 [Hesseltinella vesiculosa]|uniref:Uncharacterized protein n=1 Tax=Hesseltinella vesiculosa TaxID=101127 RepID=A0A1X2GI08_9FUNG|nr:hypothetical protein DM01DRAFT_1305594 [Hesseltinella vesiculosa]
MSKRVQFSGDVDIANTFANEDYDRTAQEVAKLSYHDMVELLTMKSQWRREMEKMVLERDLQEKELAMASSADEANTDTDTCTESNEVYTTSAHEICI